MAKEYTPLKRFLERGLEAGCDEAGRGCLAGPVFAAAVVLPVDFSHPLVRDSKTLSPRQRAEARSIVERTALAYRVVMLSPQEIDRINILQAAIKGMQNALETLGLTPEIALIDGNRFKPVAGIPHRCCVHGDAEYISIAAASILAKTYRDAYMGELAVDFPGYGWESNMGYPTKAHREAIRTLGVTPHHRKTFRLL